MWARNPEHVPNFAFNFLRDEQGNWRGGFSYQKRALGLFMHRFGVDDKTMNALNAKVSHESESQVITRHEVTQDEAAAYVATDNAVTPWKIVDLQNSMGRAAEAFQAEALPKIVSDLNDAGIKQSAAEFSRAANVMNGRTKDIETVMAQGEARTRGRCKAPWWAFATPWKPSTIRFGRKFRKITAIRRW